MSKKGELKLVDLAGNEKAAAASEGVEGAGVGELTLVN